MIIQGMADMAVPYTVTDALQQHLKGFGISVAFIAEQGNSHIQAIV